MSNLVKFGLPVVVLAAAVPVAAWTTGRMVHSSVLDNEKRALQDADTLAVVRREYHGGVFSSSETVVYGLSPKLARGDAGMAAQMAQVQLTVRNDYHHGPFPGLHGFGMAQVDTTLVLPPELLGMLTGLPSGKAPLAVHTLVDWGGGGHTRIDGPAFDVKLSPALLTWHGVTGDCDFARGIEQMRCKLASDGLGMMEERSSGGLKQFEMDFDMHRVLDAMYVGSSHMSVGAVDLKQEPSLEFSLKDLKMASDSALNGEWLDGKVTLDVGPVQAQQFTQQKAGLELDFKHLHAASLAALTKAARERHEPTEHTPAALKESLQPLLGPAYGILSRQPRLELPRIGLSTAEGSVQLSGWVTLDAVSESELQQGDPTPLLAKHLQGQADLQADEALVAKLAGSGASGERFTAQLDDLLARGMVLRKDGKLTSHLEYAGGQLKVNGQPLTPPGGGAPAGPP